MSTQSSLSPISTVLICENGKYYSGDVDIAVALVDCFEKGTLVEAGAQHILEQFGTQVRVGIHHDDGSEQIISMSELNDRLNAFAQVCPLRKGIKTAYAFYQNVKNLMENELQETFCSDTSVSGLFAPHYTSKMLEEFNLAFLDTFAKKQHVGLFISQVLGFSKN